VACVSVTPLVMAAPAQAGTTVEATSASDLSQYLNDPLVEKVILVAELGDGDREFVFANLEGVDNKVLEAGAYSLPPMHVGNGKLTIKGGSIDAFTLSAAYDEREALGWPYELTHHLIKVYGDSTLEMDGTTIDLPLEGDTNPATPASVFALYSPEYDPTDAGTMATDPAALVLRQVTTPAAPLSRALVISTATAPTETQLTIKQSDLVFTGGGTLHASWWGTTADNDPVDDAWVYVTESLLWMSTGADDPAIGMVFTPASSDSQRMPFLQSDGRAYVERSFFFNFQTDGQALVEAPWVEMSELFVETLQRHDDSPQGGALVQGQNIAVGGSLICGVKGGDAVFYADSESNTAPMRRSVHVMSSALWKVQPSLFGMALGGGADTAVPNEDGLYARNVTLQHLHDLEDGDVERTPVVHHASDHDYAPGELLNVYLQGPWLLGDAVRSSEAEGNEKLLAISVVMSDPHYDGFPCDDKAGCANAVDRHLSESVLDRNCQDIAFAYAQQLAGSEVGLDRGLKDLLPEPADDSYRPALTDLDGFPTAQTWAFDHLSPGEWGRVELDCDTGSAPESLFIGGFASDVGRCTLPLLEPISADAQPDAPDLPDPEADGEALYGLATGCRTQLGGVFLLLPLLGLRRRE